MNQLIAFNLQKRALEILKPTHFEKDLARMQKVKDEIRKAITFLDSAKAHTASEVQSLAYFDVVFKKSESAAVDHLEAMLNSPAKHE